MLANEIMQRSFFIFHKIRASEQPWNFYPREPYDQADLELKSLMGASQHSLANGTKVFTLLGNVI